MGNIRTVLGDNIRKLRNSRGWTQAYLADRLGNTSSFVTMIEAGKKGMSLDAIERLSQIFEIPVASLFLTNDSITKTESQKTLRNIELENLKKELTEKITTSINSSIDAIK